MTNTEVQNTQTVENCWNSHDALHEDCKEMDRLSARVAELEDFLRFKILGWREWDHPEFFDRQTAEYFGDMARPILNRETA